MANKRIRFLSALLTAAVIVSCCTLHGSAEPEESESEPQTTEQSQDSSEPQEESEQTSSDLTNFDESENERQRSDLKKENSEMQEELKQTKKDIKDKEKYSKELQTQIADLSGKIRKSNSTIQNLNAEIKEKQARIDSLLAEIDDILEMLRQRLRTVHMAGDTSSLEIILGARSFSDFIDKSEMIKSMSEYDQSLIDSIQGEMDVIAAEQRSLREKKNQVESEKRSLEANKKKLDQLSEENTRIIEELKKTQADLQAGIKNNQEMQKQLEDALAAYNKEKAAEAKRQRLREQSQNPEIVVPQNGDSFVWPCPGFTYLTSTFDEWRGVNNHGALDIAEGGIYGAKVVACYDGYVFSCNDTCDHDYGKFSSCGCGGGYGNYVMIDHGNGKISIYGHLSGVTVTAGQTVSAGQLIGYVGSTGYSTGPHLHFETRYNGVRYDPLTEY